MVAAQSFLAAMTREFYIRHPDAEACRVPTWESMSKADRAVLLRAMRSALKAAFDEKAISRFREKARETR